MLYTIIIQSSPTQSSSALSALKFSQALLDSGHSIYRIFLYGEAVSLSNRLITTPQDEYPLQKKWSQFIQENDLDAIVCIAAALKRGIINQAESERYEHNTHNMDTHYELSGLGQLIDATAHSDKVITFS